MTNKEQFEQELINVVKGMNVGQWKRVYGSGGLGMYVTPCASECGNPVLSWSRRKNIFKCAFCRKQEKAKEKELNSKINSLVMEKRIEDSKKMILNQVGSLDEYERSFDIIELKKGEPNWFQSKWEVMAAAELIRLRIKTKHQFSVGKYRVDFLLPDLKIALEIDGGFHEITEYKDKDRKKDAELMRDLGPGWRIVRISHRLLKAEIKELLPKIKRTIRRTLRAQTAL